jgi:hypothetical protein
LITCVEILIIFIKLKIEIFNYWVWTSDLSIFELKNVTIETHLDLNCPTQTIESCLLFCINITCQKLKVEKSTSKVKIWDLINYSTIYYWMYSSTTILAHLETNM